jgi:hypothetical protein
MKQGCPLSRQGPQAKGNQMHFHQFKNGAHSGKWAISRVETIDCNGIGGSRSRDANRVRMTTLFWTGSAWTKNADDAKLFDTCEDAQNDEQLAAQR